MAGVGLAELGCGGESALLYCGAAVPSRSGPPTAPVGRIGSGLRAPPHRRAPVAPLLLRNPRSGKPNPARDVRRSGTPDFGTLCPTPARERETGDDPPRAAKLQLSEPRHDGRTEHRRRWSNENLCGDFPIPKRALDTCLTNGPGSHWRPTSGLIRMQALRAAVLATLFATRCAAASRRRPSRGLLATSIPSPISGTFSWPRSEGQRKRRQRSPNRPKLPLESPGPLVEHT